MVLALRLSLIGLLGLVFLGGAGLGMAWYGLQQPIHLAEPVVLEIPRGESLARSSQRLAAAGVIRHPRLLQGWARLNGQAARIKAGEYEFSGTMDMRQVLAQLVAGRVRLYSLTLVEGWTVHQVLAAFREREELAQTLSVQGPEQLLAALGLATEAGASAHAEGWFFPDTYVYPRGTTDVSLLRQAHQRMQQELARVWAQRDTGLALTDPYQALILASIIEKETGKPADRTRISQVFHSRLQLGMRLQTDPTVIYGYGPAFDGRLTRRRLHTDHAYNTYTRHGLPPTPIALPGRASLEAAVQPADTDYLFFVSRGDGSSHFSRDYEAHRAAVRRYQLGLED